LFPRMMIIVILITIWLSHFLGFFPFLRINFFLRNDLAVRCHILFMHITGFFIYIAVEDRDDEQCEHCTAQQSADYDSTHRCNHILAFTDTHGKRKHPECRSENGNDNGSEAVEYTELQRFKSRHAFFFLLVCIVHKKYGVIDDYTEQHYDTDE